MDYFKLQDGKIDNKIQIYETKENKEFFQRILITSDIDEEITEILKEKNIKVVIGSFDNVWIDHIFGEFWYVTEEIMEVLKVYDSEINFDRITVNGYFGSGGELWIDYYRGELKEFDKSSIEHIEGRRFFQWNNESGYEIWIDYYRVELKEFDKSSIEHIEGRQIFQWNNGYETYPVVSLRVLESILRISGIGIDFEKIDIEKIYVLNDGTRRMEKEWIEDRLVKDLGGDKRMANEIFRNYDSVLVNVAPDGSITKYNLDDKANIIK